MLKLNIINTQIIFWFEIVTLYCLLWLKINSFLFLFLFLYFLLNMLSWKCWKKVYPSNLRLCTVNPKSFLFNLKKTCFQITSFLLKVDLNFKMPVLEMWFQRMHECDYFNHFHPRYDIRVTGWICNWICVGDSWSSSNVTSVIRYQSRPLRWGN